MAASSSNSHPILRSGEDCRHFIFNSYPGIAVERADRRIDPPASGIPSALRFKFCQGRLTNLLATKSRALATSYIVALDSLTVCHFWAHEHGQRYMKKKQAKTTATSNDPFIRGKLRKDHSDIACLSEGGAEGVPL
jgi:hypothetical protein